MYFAKSKNDYVSNLILSLLINQEKIGKFALENFIFFFAKALKTNPFMEFITSKILAKLSKLSAIYQTESPFDDYDLDSNTLWTFFSQFQILEKSFRFFLSEEVFSGILFCKSKKPDKKQWFRARFYRLYSDRLVLYSVILFFRKNKILKVY